MLRHRFHCPLCYARAGVYRYNHTAEHCFNKTTVVACNFCGGPHKITTCPLFSTRISNAEENRTFSPNGYSRERPSRRMNGGSLPPYRANVYRHSRRAAPFRPYPYRRNPRFERENRPGNGGREGAPEGDETMFYRDDDYRMFYRDDDYREEEEEDK